MSTSAPAPAIYTPRPGTLPARVCYFFKCNPEEELTLDDITSKFDAGRANIHTQLVYALEAKLVKRAKNGDDEWVYTAGPQLFKYGGDLGTPPDTTAPTTLAQAIASNANTLPKPKRGPRQALPVITLPDPTKVLIEVGIHLPTVGRNAQRQDWTPLLKRLQPGQSAQLPQQASYILGKNITQAHKDKLGTFAVRINKEAQTLRVWRTA